MRTIRFVARILCTIGILIVGVYTTIAIAVAFFIVTDTRAPGDVMLYDSATPTLLQTLIFIGVGSTFVWRPCVSASQAVRI
jgi:hypothetical protein